MYKMNNARESELKEMIVETLEHGYRGYACDLHHEVFNTDYFIIGTYKAKQYLGDEAFDAIETIIEYEHNHFGECTTDLSDPEKVVNMLVYILGEEIINGLESITGENWNNLIDDELAQSIIDELEA